MENLYDVIIIGGGPAGLAVASKTKEKGFSVLLIEREEHLGGILKQCIHDGFGLTRYGTRLTGPEYAYKDIEEIRKQNVEVLTSTFVLDVKKENDIFNLTITNEKGIDYLTSKTIVFATGCRERTARQVLIHGTRPSGVFTAGCVQNLINIQGLLPCKNAVILGSGDIGLIMARRLTLEGCHVEGVYEAKSTPSGLPRNIAQCLDDFNIPLYLSKTVSRTIGTDRLEAVEICDVDSNLNPIKGSEKVIKCDSLILSVGLIPENELIEKLNVEFSSSTKGPIVDNNLMTSLSGAFSVGNCLSVNDLVDYVSENGFIASNGIEKYLKNSLNNSQKINVLNDENILCVIPQKIDLNSLNEKTIFYIRSRKNFLNKKVVIKENDKEIFSKSFNKILSPESIRLEVNLKDVKTDIKVEII